MQNKDKKVTHSKSRPHQNVRDTSIANYPSLKASTKTAKEELKVLQYLKGNSPASRRMIATGTGIPLSNMTRLVFDLVKAKKVQELHQKRKCQISGVNVYYVQLVHQ